MQFLGKIKFILIFSISSLKQHKSKSVLIGVILAFGTFLFFTGNALISSMEAAMGDGVIHSLSGHLQLYSKDAKDKLSLFGNSFLGEDNLGQIDHFLKIKRELGTIENVQSVIPMGINFAQAYLENEFEGLIDSLRQAYNLKKQSRFLASAQQFRRIAEILKNEFHLRQHISRNHQATKAQLDDLDRATSSDFWNDFKQNPQQNFEFLDTKIAPLLHHSASLGVRYVGTDLQNFSKNFNRFEITKGEMVPKGKAGFLFNEFSWENNIKHKIARNFDKLEKALVQDHLKILNSPRLMALVRENVNNFQSILIDLDQQETILLTHQLQRFLSLKTHDIGSLTKSFLAVDDDNFISRRQFFYQTIAPMIKLYAINIGDSLVLRAYQRNGYSKVISIKVYGVFKFKGLEENELANSYNLMDLISFRLLHNLSNQKDKEEIDLLRKEVALVDIKPETAEKYLFGNREHALNSPKRSESDPLPLSFFNSAFSPLSLAGHNSLKNKTCDKIYTQKEIDGGPVLNAAVFIKNPSQLQQTLANIRALAKAKNLNIQVVDWSEATGIVAQFITVIKIILYVFISFIFIIAMVIINNSLIIATMKRVKEIGMMRAIGASRRLVKYLFLLESIFLGLISACLGSLLGYGFITYFHARGIPAFSNILKILFAGSHLYPTSSSSHFWTSLFIIMTLCLVASFYSVRIATKIKPIAAINRAE